MIRNNPYVDEIIVFREKLRRWNLGVFRSLMRSLRGRNGFDCAVVLNTVSRSFSSDCIALLSKAPTIVGPNHLHYPFDSVERIYTVLAKRSPEDRTEIERNLEIVKAIGAESDGYEYDLHLTTEEQAEGRRVFNELFPKKQRPVVCVHFGAENPERVFPLEKLAAVIERLVNDFDVEIVLLVGPHEQARKVILLQQLTVHVKVAPLMPLRTAAAFIGLCELFICNDTGTLHIASSQRVPTVSFHSRNDPALWKPPHQRHIALRAFDHLITSITVDETMQACKGALESYGTKEVIPIVE
jgi:ADP-heptose:LPS heptosyltransferase